MSFDTTWTGTLYLTSLFSRSPVWILTFSSHDTCCLPDDDMIQLLQASSALVELTIQHTSARMITKSFLLHFAHHPENVQSSRLRLLPALQTLKVNYSSLFFNLDAFRQVEICLVSPTKDTIPSIDVATMARLQEVRDIGVNIICCENRD